jgi:hypothetical protein
MKLLLKAAIAALALLAIQPAAHASFAVEEKHLLKGKQEINSQFGYIYMHGERRHQGMFLPIPDDEERAAFETERKANVDGVKARNSEKQKAWAAQRDANGGREPALPMMDVVNPKWMAPFELQRPAVFGPTFVYAKYKKPDQFAYLTAVRPGRYFYYGPLMGVGGYGLCFCMGSFWVEVNAEEITNLGDMVYNMGADTLGAVPGVSPAEFDMAGVDYTLPVSLADYPNRIPELHPYGKSKNFFGVTIGRAPPIKGVLSYHRGEIVDPQNSSDMTLPPPSE